MKYERAIEAIKREIDSQKEYLKTSEGHANTIPVESVRLRHETKAEELRDILSTLNEAVELLKNAS